MFKLCILILLSTVAYVSSAVAIYPYTPKPAGYEDQEGCWIVDLKLVLPYNVPHYPTDKKSCVQYTCGTNNETQLVSCGSIAFPENCRLVRDYTLNYPKCCGTVVCDPTTTTQEPTTEPITEEPTTEPITEQPTTETCVTVTEKPCEGATLPRKPKSPKNPKEPECPKTPKNPKLSKIQGDGRRYTLPVEPNPVS